MRTLSSGATTAVSTEKGTKPLILIEISWVEDTPVSKYADKDIGSYQGKILNISSIDEIVKVSGGSNSAEVSIILDDIDGTLKDIIDNHDIHKRPCFVYQLFEGLDPDTDKFLLMRGEISSPITWDEGSRQLSFKALSKIESAEIGFSIEEGQFPLLPIELVGKAWPLAFGNVVNVPALRITSPRKGILADGFGISDYTLRRRIQLANAICCPSNSIIGYDTRFGTNPINALANTNPNSGQPSDVSVQYGSFGIIPVGNVVISPDPSGPANNGSVANGTSTGTNSGVTQVPIYGPDPDCLKNKCEIIEELNYERTQQALFEFPTIKIFGGNQFEQGVQITLAINGSYVRGIFSGETFTITQRIHPDMVSNKTYTSPPTSDEILFILNQDSNRRAVMPTFGTENPADATIARIAVDNQGPGTVGSRCAGGVYSDITDCQSTSLKSLNDFPSASFTWVNAGSEVVYAYDEEVIYVANILPSTVKCVTAYRTLDNGQRLLLVVPPEYYTVRTVDYGAYNVVEIVMSRSLSLQADGWEDQIYVSMDSSVGPNTVDIIQWLIETYTEFDIDATSFAAVSTSLQNYPSSFALFDRKNILQALDEISFQARCALFLRDNTFFIKYLSASPTTVSTITEDHVTQNSLQITNTDTEELVTKMIVTWNDDYALPKKLVILRNNINRYGTQAENFDFYIYNMYQLVEKSAIFWLIRKSNTWRKMKFKTPLVKMALESFDDVLFTLADMSDSSFKGQVESATFNPDGNSMDFEIWTPLLAGTRTLYPWAYPATVDPGQLWPPDIESQGIGFGVVAPIGHPLSSSTFPQDVPDDVTAPNFQVSNCQGPLNDNTNFCCTAVTQAQPSEFCQFQQPRRVDDANDVMPPARTDISCPGAVNLGKDPTFANAEPKFRAILKKANFALQQAASAKDKALNAGGGAGGGGGAGQQDQDQVAHKKDTFDKIPRKETNPPTDPAKPATCTTTIAIAWFPIVGVQVGEFLICEPDGPTRTETHTFGGCKDANKADGSAGAAKGMTDLLISKGVDPDTFQLCDGGYDNSPCCHATVQIISPNCALCDKGDNDGLWMKVDKTGNNGEPFQSIFEHDDMGDEGPHLP